MSNKELDKLIDRIPKKNKYMVTIEEVVNYIFILENRIDKAINEIQYIRDLGFDYDGLNNICDLKSLIDELIRIAKGSIDILRGEEINEIKIVG